MLGISQTWMAPYPATLLEPRKTAPVPLHQLDLHQTDPAFPAKDQQGYCSDWIRVFSQGEGPTQAQWGDTIELYCLFPGSSEHWHKELLVRLSRVP